MQHLVQEPGGTEEEDDIREILLTRFKGPSLLFYVSHTRVIDHLHVSPLLLNYAAILLALDSIWEGVPPYNNSLRNRAAAFLTSSRLLYGVSVLFYLVFLGTLVRISLFPSISAFISANLGATVYTWLYAFGTILQVFSLASFPAALVFAIITAEFIWPTSSPLALHMILLALLVYAVYLQLVPIPSISSPLIIVAPRQTLILSSVLMRKATNAILLPLMFFGPLMIVSLIVLSISLQGIPPPATSILSNSITEGKWSPYPTRLFYAILFLMLCCMGLLLFYTVLSSEQTTHGQNDTEIWNGYGSAVACSSKNRWAQIVAHWSTSKATFPPPLNIFYIVYKVCKRFLVLLHHGLVNSSSSQ